MNYLPELASNHNPPDLSLSGSWGYRNELLAPRKACLLTSPWFFIWIFLLRSNEVMHTRLLQSVQ
jgi:hypothetical protein